MHIPDATGLSSSRPAHRSSCESGERRRSERCDPAIPDGPSSLRSVTATSYGPVSPLLWRALPSPIALENAVPIPRTAMSAAAVALVIVLTGLGGSHCGGEHAFGEVSGQGPHDDLIRQDGGIHRGR